MGAVEEKPYHREDGTPNGPTLSGYFVSAYTY